MSDCSCGGVLRGSVEVDGESVLLMQLPNGGCKIEYTV